MRSEEIPFEITYIQQVNVFNQFTYLYKLDHAHNRDGYSTNCNAFRRICIQICMQIVKMNTCTIYITYL